MYSEGSRGPARPGAVRDGRTGCRRALAGGLVAAVLLAAAPMVVPAPVLAAPTPSPGASPPSTANAPSLPLPTLDPQQVIYQAIAGILYSFDSLLITEMEKLWNPMVAGTDDLEGREGFGPGLLVDNSRLRQMWGVSFGIATGSLMILLVALLALLWLLGEASGRRHDLGRNLVYFLFTVIMMGASFFLVQQLINVDNALVQGVNSQVALELRSLPSFQRLGLQNPAPIQDVNDLLKAITIFLIIVFVALELVVIFVIYFIRLVLIWVLVVVAPFVFAFSILPQGRGLAVYWLRMLVATVAVKFVNVLVFTTFVFMGAASDVALINVIVVATMLLFMILVPATIMRALGEPGTAISSVQETWRTVTHHQPLRRASSQAWHRLRRR